jgi:hypothetical protein
MVIMPLRRVINIVTILLIVLLLVALRSELLQAWNLLGQVNLWILWLLLPLQLLAYYANGAIIFSFLRRKGNLGHVSPLESAKVALEFNFVNHALPSAGISGLSYMTWRLRKLGVGAGRATLSQVVRLVAIFGAFLLLLPISVVLITFDGTISRFILMMSASIATAIVFAVAAFIFIIDSENRLRWFSRGLYHMINALWTKIFRRKRKLIKLSTLTDFLSELHEDYEALKRKPSDLLRPFIWGVVTQVVSVAMFFVTFWSLGITVNPGLILIALGLASLSAAIVITPGGAGLYEALMIAILSTAGLGASAALAGVVLTRVILVLFTIASGYIFYHLALEKYGKRPAER